MNTPEHIARLLFRHTRGELSPQEARELSEWRSLSPDNEQVFRDANDPEYIRREIAFLYASKDRVFKKLQEEFNLAEPSGESGRSRLYRILSSKAAIAVISVSITLYVLLGIDFGPVPGGHPSAAGHQAEFTQSGGLATALDDMHRGFRDGYAAGKLARSSGAIPVFIAVGNPKAPDGQYNTLRTLKGGRFCLQLPDGARAWLNERSSVTYPVNYSVDSERISLEGEVYVELTENKSAYTPFRVRLNGMQFEATEGRFNVRAYPGDTVTLTALDGDLKLDSLSGQPAFLLLHPRQQAVIVNGKIRQVLPEADILKVLAWKISKQ